MTTTLLAYIPSPAQGVWHLGFLPIRAYALCIITGIIAALLIGDRRWVARGGQPGVIYDIALWAVPFGLIGGRLYHVMTDWPTYFGDNGAGFVAALRIWDGGLGIWGAVALGGVGAWIACRRRGIPLPAFGDAIAPGIVLAQAIGRLGNYFNQELYGRVTTLPWGLEVFERRDANGALDTLNGVSTGQQIAVVHPTFLYELLWNLLVFAMLIWVDRRFKLGHGRLFALYVAGYCVGRFWIELMRSDHATDFGGIRVNSFTSTFVFIGAVIYIMVATKGRDDPASLAGNDIDDDAEPSLLDKVAVDVAAVATESGIVAAAVVADKSEAAESEAGEKAAGESKAADSTTGDTEPAAEPDVEPEEGLGSIEGDDLAAAVDDAPEAHAAAVEDEEKAEDLEAVVAGDAEKSEPTAEPKAEKAEPEVEPEEGLGSVESDDVASAVEDAPEVHAAAVEKADEAEELEADVAGDAEPEVVPAQDVRPVDEADEVEELESDVADESAREDGSEIGGLGSVEGDDVAAAVEGAPEVHAEAVEGTEDAEELESDVAAEADEPAPKADPEAKPEAEPEAEAEPDADAKVAPEEGLGSVDGGEASAAVTAAPKIHAATAKGATEAEALSSEVEAEEEPAKDGKPE